MNQLIIAMLLSVLPVSELRGALPLAVDYALKNNVSVFLVFFLILFLNISVIFFIFFFLDFLHKSFLKFRIYKNIFAIVIKRTRKKVDKVERRIPSYGYLALSFFTAIPFPVTGAWTACLIAWLLGLERKKSILAISFGVLMAGIIVLLASLGVIKLTSFFTS